MNKSTTLRPLADVLREGADELARLQAPPERESAVLAAMRAAQQRRAAAMPTPPATFAQALWRRLTGWMRPLVWSGAATCGVLLLGATVLLLQEPPLRDEPVALGSGFMPLVSSERWSSFLRENGDAAAAQAWVVSTEMPRERLALLGLPYDPAQAGDSVRAELLMHRSGDVLAVRFVR